MQKTKHGAIYKDSISGFFRMFGDVKPIHYRTSVLRRLAKSINTKSRPDNLVPAGLTYLGQFIDHDITRMRRSAEIPNDGPVDVKDLIMERTPALDLDSVYGDGFEAGLGKTVDAYGKFTGPVDKNGLLFDLPRRIYQWPLARRDHVWKQWELDSLESENLLALVPDDRNDENFIISQLHVFFLNLHNLLAAQWYPEIARINRNELPETTGQKAFFHARLELVYLYQLVVVNDFLQTFLEKNVFDYLFRTENLGENKLPRLLDYFPAEVANIPVEFSGAAFRFGHSLVRESYRIGDVNLDLKGLFRMTGKGRLQPPRPGDQPVDFIRNHQIQWETFFPVKGISQNVIPGNPIIENLVDSMRGMINEEPGNQDLLLRNLLRGKELAIPSAQDIIASLNKDHREYLEAMGCFPLQVITVEQLRNHPIGPALEIDRLHEKTPLWLYILLEPYFNGSNASGKTRLGMLGSIIVGETMRMLIDLSSISIFKHDPMINPLGFMFFARRPLENEKDIAAMKEDFGMKDFIMYLKKCSQQQ